MKAGRSKGPWVSALADAGTGAYSIHSEGSGKHFIGTIAGQDNAALVAAAPDLYEALRDLLTDALLQWPEGDFQPPSIATAVAALAKAEGRKP